MNDETIILANGEFPKRGSEALHRLAAAKRVVACDGAAANFLKAFDRVPDLIVGDLDSLEPATLFGCEVVKIAEQETNDLAKAIRVCRARGWNKLAIVGACGKREDHFLGNIALAAEEGIEVISDFGCFIPVKDEAELEVRKGASVSVFSFDGEAKVVSRGLEWKLDGVKLGHLYSASLNRASEDKIYLKTTRPILVYLAFAV